MFDIHLQVFDVDSPICVILILIPKILPPRSSGSPPTFPLLPPLPSRFLTLVHSTCSRSSSFLSNTPSVLIICVTQPRSLHVCSLARYPGVAAVFSRCIRMPPLCSALDLFCSALSQSPHTGHTNPPICTRTLLFRSAAVSSLSSSAFRAQDTQKTHSRPSTTLPMGTLLSP